MSHEISINKNNEGEAFYAYKPAWHGLGTVVQNTPTSEEAIKLAKLDWNVETVPAYAQVSIIGLPQTYNKVKGKFATIRADTKEPLGIVGKNYQVVQNTEAFKFLDGLVSSNELLYESAGALKGGRHVWMLARFPEEVAITADDTTRDYILMINAHDGSKAIRIMSTNVRVVCWNTLTLALNSREESLCIQHKGNMQGKLDDAREMLGIIGHTSQQVNEIMKQLAKKEVKQLELSNYIDKIFPLPVVNNTEVEQQVSTRLLNTRSKVNCNFEMMNTSATKGTAYGMFNAVTEYVDHQRSPNNLERQFESALIGSGNKIKLKAYECAKELLV